MVSFFNAVIGKFCRKDVREEILNRLLGITLYKEEF